MRRLLLTLALVFITVQVSIAQATTATVHLTWTAGSHATSYKINKKTNAAAYVNTYATVASPTVAFDDAGQAVGNTFCYTVTASNAFGDAVASNECCSAIFSASSASGLNCSVSVP